MCLDRYFVRRQMTSRLQLRAETAKYEPHGTKRVHMWKMEDLKAILLIELGCTWLAAQPRGCTVDASRLHVRETSSNYNFEPSNL